MAVILRRMLKRKEFLAAKADGARVNTQAFVLQHHENTENTLVVGFTCSGALGGAVKRNRAKRRLMAAFDLVCRLNDQASGGGKSMVFVGKMPIFEIGFDYLVKDMRAALTAAGVDCAA